MLRYSGRNRILRSIISRDKNVVELRRVIRDFTRSEVEPQALEFNRIEKFNMPLFKQLAAIGGLGVTVGEKYGGIGLGPLGAVVLMEELCYSDPAFCLSVLAHTMLFANNLEHNGSESQKNAYLPGCVNGSVIGGMCMSEPAVGTDVLGITTSAVRSGDGKGYVLSGTKMWVTNGVVGVRDSQAKKSEEGASSGLIANPSMISGDAFLVYAKLKPANRISLFLVPKDSPGFSVGQRLHDKLGMRASGTAELVFSNVFVPLDHLVGEEGNGLKPMMRNLEFERVTLAAMSLGIARRCIDEMVKYSNTRKAFGEHLSSFGQIQRYIGRSFASYSAARCYVYEVASELDLSGHQSQRIDSDGVKLMASAMAKEAADSAIQVLGGYGYLGESVVERLWRDAKLLEIGGGTLEAHEKNICNDLSKSFTSGSYPPAQSICLHDDSN